MPEQSTVTQLPEWRKSSLAFLKDWFLPLAIEAAIFLVIHFFICFIVIVPTGSMLPTIEEDSVLLASRMHDPAKIERGDILIFDHESGVKFVKRCIGLPGESVDIDADGNVYINGEALDEPYVKNQSAVPGTFEVPEDNYLFLGDNRAASNDARYWDDPYIHKDDINGTAMVSLWPVGRLN